MWLTASVWHRTRRLLLGAVRVVCFTYAVSVLLTGEASAEALIYSYDDLGRLKQVVDQDGNAATYNYDAVGNIISIERGTPSCPVQAPMVTNVASAAACYAGTGCQIAISGNSLLGAGVSSGTPQASVSDCHAECTQITCILATSPFLPAGPLALTVNTSFGSAQGAVQIVAPPTIEAAGAAGIWHFAANAGTVVTLSMTRIANQADGSSTLDPYLELLDSRGFLIAQDDDGGSNLPPGPGSNAILAHLILPATDTYILAARGRGGTYGPYILNIDPANVVPLPGAIVAPPQGREITFTGTVGAISERDTFTVAANAGETARIEVRRVANNPDGSGTLDPAVELRDSRNVLLASDDDGGTNAPPGPGRNALIANLRLPATDTYRVIAFSSSGATGPYEIHVTLTADAPAGAAATMSNGGTP